MGITNGLGQNKSMPVELLMTVAHGFTSDGYEGIISNAKSQSESQEPTTLRPKSCLLLPEAPGRSGFKPKTTAATNKNIMIDFGLQILQMCLRREKIRGNNPEHLGMLDPFVPILSKCLDARYLKTASMAMQTLCLVMKYPSLPSLKTHLKDIVDAVFVVVHRYGTGGLTKKGDVADLISASYKAMNIVLHKLSAANNDGDAFHKLTDDQLKAMVIYVEHDLDGADSLAAERQPTAFSMLKALLNMKFQSKEIPALMEKVFNLSIKSPMEGVRQHCRQLALQYILNYPVGKQIKGHLQFYLRQLEYEGYDEGRESALEMLQSFFTSFPQKTLDNYATNVIFLPLAARLINEESAKCRKMVGVALKTLLQKLGQGERDSCFELVLCWLSTDVEDPSSLPQRRLAGQLIGIFAEAEGPQFERRVEKTLPLMTPLMAPEDFEEEEQEKPDEEDGWTTVGKPKKSDSSVKDSLLFMLLNSCKKIFAVCPSIRKNKDISSSLDSVLDSTSTFLCHPHSWVRLLSAQIFGLFFASFKFTDFKELAVGDAVFFGIDVVGRIRGLCGSFCHQMQSDFLTKELATQIVKNLLFLAKLIRFLHKEFKEMVMEEEFGDGVDVTMEEDAEAPEVPPEVSPVVDSETGETAPPPKMRSRLTLDFLLRRLTFEALRESTQIGKGTLRQTSALQWCAALVMEAEDEEVKTMLTTMLRPLRRISMAEVGDGGDAAEREALKQLAKEFSDILKKKVGEDEFANAMIQVEKMAVEKRAVRRQQAAVLKVVNPQVAAVKKMAKKRKGSPVGAKGAKKGKKSKVKLKDLAVIE